MYWKKLPVIVVKFDVPTPSRWIRVIVFEEFFQTLFNWKFKLGYNFIVCLFSALFTIGSSFTRNCRWKNKKGNMISISFSYLFSVFLFFFSHSYLVQFYLYSRHIILYYLYTFFLHFQYHFYSFNLSFFLFLPWLYTFAAITWQITFLFTGYLSQLASQ